MSGEAYAYNYENVGVSFLCPPRVDRIMPCPSSRQGIGYCFVNVGLAGLPGRSVVAYMNENVGVAGEPVDEGLAYMNENVT